MSNKEDKKKFEKIGKEAWARLQKEKVSLIPENYHVWFSYYENKNPEITHAIDMLEKDKVKFSDESMYDLYIEFLDNEQNSTVVKEAGSQVYDTVAGLSSRIDNLNNNNRIRGGRIVEATKSIAKESESTNIKNMVGSVVSDTQKILHDNTVLAQELEKSKTEMLTLQQDLATIKKEAATDGLTGLLNRKAFDLAIEKAVVNVDEEERPFSLLMIDIDHFKKFNDTYGHQVGDQVLKLVANTLKNGVKGGDVVARYGGEEFCIILPKTFKQSALTVAEHLRKNVSSKDLVNRGSGKVLGHIKLSIGLAEYKTGEKIDDLIGRTDKALYSAKENGRDQVVISNG